MYFNFVAVILGTGEH